LFGGQNLKIKKYWGAKINFEGIFKNKNKNWDRLIMA
jgi:hypothetical protein